MYTLSTVNVTSGPAGGKMMTKVTGPKGLIGYIQPTHVDFGSLGCHTLYISQAADACNSVLCDTLYDAFLALGLDLDVLIYIDEIELPEGVYCETQNELKILKSQRRF